MLWRHFMIMGRVQGVWFRQTAKDNAVRIGIFGWVRNCPNGNVEALAGGSEAQLAQFEKCLYQGSAHSCVESIQVTDCSPQNFQDFSIR
ncbi:MAG: acylphosphatase [Gammaproteobacteria bacterium]|nr:acylphosphatase [Gammaproteobacteria bacterium]